MDSEKILLVEDNKALSKLIARKVTSNTDFEVDIAHSLADAQTLIAKESYFMALLDLNLPDAPNGEVVDYVLGKNIPSIVLTANVDKETRDAILQKDIIDYVYKSNMDDVNYIFTLINRLSKNREYKVLIVDDSMAMRNNIKRMLSSQMYQVLVAAHGEEAMSFIVDNPDIKLVMCDYNMPVMDGFELVKTIRETYAKIQMTIIGFTMTSDEMLSSKFLKIGANDFITKPFSREELVCRVNNAIESLEYIETISDMANTDFLTGVSNRRYFFKQMNAFLDEEIQVGDSFALAMLDIDSFKQINDTHGHDVGDIVIKDLAQILKKNTKGSDAVARFGGEEFCIAIKNIDKNSAVEFFVRLRHKIASHICVVGELHVGFTVSIGVAFNDDDNDLDRMLSEADMAMYRAKNNGKNRVEIAEN